jgi:hypothetical protein
MNAAHTTFSAMNPLDRACGQFIFIGSTKFPIWDAGNATAHRADLIADLDNEF